MKVQVSNFNLCSSRSLYGTSKHPVEVPINREWLTSRAVHRNSNSRHYKHHHYKEHTHLIIKALPHCSEFSLHLVELIQTRTGLQLQLHTECMRYFRLSTIDIILTIL